MSISITNEHDISSGWSFVATVTGQPTGEHVFTIRLAWADYNLWSPDGGDRPADVARAVLSYMLSQEPAAEMGETFDAAAVRRRYPDADEQIPTYITRGE